MANFSVIKDCNGRHCCGAVRYLLDECDGTVPWKCYWAYETDDSVGTPNIVSRDKSGWSMDGNRMRGGLYNSLSLGNNVYQDILVKVKSYAPPWTFEAALKFEDLVSTGTPPAGYYFNAFFYGTRFQVQNGRSSGLYTRYNIVRGSFTSGGTSQTTDGYFIPAGNKVYMKMSVDASWNITMDVKIDDVNPTMTSGVSFPVTFAETNATVKNAWTNVDWWPFRISMYRGGWLQYLELKVTTP